MTRAKRRRLNNNDAMDNKDDDWNNYPEEKVSRIWEWWMIQLHVVKNSRLMFFAQAIRIFFLTQLSSCAAERFFTAKFSSKSMW